MYAAIGVLIVRGLVRFFAQARPEASSPPARGTPAEPTVREDESECRWMKLADEHGVATWLDLHTGAVTEQRGMSKATPALAPMMPIVTAALTERGLKFFAHGQEHLLVPYRESAGRYVVVLTVVERERRLEAWCALGTIVPERARVAVAELVERLNARDDGGIVHLDESGDLSIACGLLLPKQELDPEVVHQLIQALLGAVEQAHGPVLRVAFGGLSAEAALVEADLW